MARWWRIFVRHQRDCFRSSGTAFGTEVVPDSIIDARLRPSVILDKKTIMNLIRRFLASEDGPTAVEYAVMLALIIVVCIGTVTNIGTKANASFQSSKTGLDPV